MFKTTTSKRAATFRRGAGVFACRSCHRQTRGGHDSADLRLCEECYDLGGMYNTFSDQSWTKANLDELGRLADDMAQKAAHCVALGGKAALIYGDVQEVAARYVAIKDAA